MHTLLHKTQNKKSIRAMQQSAEESIGHRQLPSNGEQLRSAGWELLVLAVDTSTVPSKRS